MNKYKFFSFFLIVFVLLCLCTTPSAADVTTLKPDQIRKGMTGYGVTVFEGTQTDTFPITVLGVLNNAMPDQDMILIKADTKLLNHTMIMSGMSGSPIYVNGKLIGALAYSWSFEKEPIAGVTPIENILEANQRNPLDPSHEHLKKISTPIVASGFRGSIKQVLGSQLSERGLNPQFIAGGQANGPGPGNQSSRKTSLSPGSAVGVQLMRGELSLTAIGTVTHVEGDQVYAFGHPFLGAGQIEFPMTTAEVLTYMPSYQSSFKLASPIQTVGTVTEDRQASIVGQAGIEPDLLPVDITLNSPDQNYQESFHVEIIRNQHMTPGLLNSAIANFSTSKLEQKGINWMEVSVTATVPNRDNLRFKQTKLASGSYNPWAFLPLLRLWSNPFQSFEPESINVNITLHHGRQSARIEDIWTNGSPVVGESLLVYTRINPFRSDPFVKRTKVSIPKTVQGKAVRISAVPSSQLEQLKPKPHSFSQLIQSLNQQQSPRKLAIVLEVPEVTMTAEGQKMEYIPFSIAGTYQAAAGNQTQPRPTTHTRMFPTDWVLRGSQSRVFPLKKP